MIDERLIKAIDKLNEKYPFEWVGDNSLRLDFDFDKINFKPMSWDEFYKEDDWHNYLNWEWRNIIEPKLKLYFNDLIIIKLLI